MQELLTLPADLDSGASDRASLVDRADSWMRNWIAACSALSTADLYDITYRRYRPIPSPSLAST